MNFGTLAAFVRLFIFRRRTDASFVQGADFDLSKADILGLLSRRAAATSAFDSARPGESDGDSCFGHRWGCATTTFYNDPWSYLYLHVVNSLNFPESRKK